MYRATYIFLISPVPFSFYDTMAWIQLRDERGFTIRWQSVLKVAIIYISRTRRKVVRSLRNYRVTITYRVETRSQSPSNNYADLAAPTVATGVVFAGQKISRREKTREGNIDEDGGTPRRDGMEMVGDWNPRGESLPKRSKPSGDASVTELTLPCAFVRKRGPLDSRFLCITHAVTYTCARTYTPIHPRLSLRTSLSV